MRILIGHSVERLDMLISLGYKCILFEVGVQNSTTFIFMKDKNKFGLMECCVVLAFFILKHMCSPHCC